jgi:predicted DNA-binding transcriptional regulator AlpA
MPSHGGESVPKILTLREVSERTRIPLPTLRYYRHRGDGPPTFALGGRVMAFEQEVDDWILAEANKDRSRRGTGAAPERVKRLAN